MPTFRVKFENGKSEFIPCVDKIELKGHNFLSFIDADNNCIASFNVDYVQGYVNESLLDKKLRKEITYFADGVYDYIHNKGKN